MKKHAVLTALGAVLAVLATACQTPPTAAPPSSPDCPYPDNVIQFNGDSLGIHIPRYVEVNGELVVNRSEPRAGFTYDIPFDPARNLPAVDSIGTTVKKWITQCGVPDLVIVQGGINDIAGASVPAATIQAAVTELSNWLQANQVPTLWVAVQPLSTAGSYMWSYPVRQAYNAWLTSGNVWGRTVNCAGVLQDPAVPDTLNPIYWQRVDLFGHIDGVHPNQAGYDVFGQCVADAATQALAG